MKKVRKAAQPSTATKGHRYPRLACIATQFVALLAFWLVLSGRYQASYLALGTLAAGLVTFLTYDLLYPRVYSEGRRETGLCLTVSQWCRLFGYLPWLVFSIVKANLQVAYLILHPRLPIDPTLIKLRTQLRSSVAQVTLANSITLTPGTVTIDLKEGRYLIHALVPQAAQSLVAGRMQNKVAAIFAEQEEQSPTVLWASSIEEVER